jgi:hypothetical protein
MSVFRSIFFPKNKNKLKKEKKTKMTRNKMKMTTIALVLMLNIVATSIVFLPSVNAVTERDITPLLSVFPNPVGVGQTVTILVFTQPLPPTSNDRFFDLTVTMKKPDGTTQTFGPSVSGPLGNVIWTFVPDQTGTYAVVFSIPDQSFPDRDVFYHGADSPTVEITVQQEQIVGFPDVPKSEDFWDFPIDAQNRIWADNIGAWLRSSYNASSNNYNPYTTGPKTAHVLWKWRNALGGLEGGGFGPVAYAQGRAYEGKMTPSIIINNIFYQYGPVGDRVNNPHNLNAIDLATGEVIWSKPMESAGVGVGLVSLYGQILRVDSVNQVGLHAYLWNLAGSTWRMFDAFTGDWIMNFENASGGGVMVFEPVTGNMLYYMIDTHAGWMAMWNQSKCFDQSEGTYGGVYQYQSNEIRAANGVYGAMFRPRDGAENDWRKGIEWNVTIPSEAEWSARPASVSWGGISGAGGVLVAEGLWNDPVLVPKMTKQLYGYSLDNDNPRKLYGPVNATVQIQTSRAVGENTYVIMDPNNRRYLGYNLQTGALKWESDQMTYPWGSYASLSPTICNGKLYASCYDGFWAFDIDTGDEVFHATTGNAGIETPYGTWVGRGGGKAIGGGYIYWTTGVWHPVAVMHRGDTIRCIDWNTGDEVWDILGFYERPILANGYLVALNLYDNTFYCYNKGPSATTVSASPKVATSGSAVLIDGTVTDQSPAAKDLVERGVRNMVPAIADEDMTGWMEYLYMDQPQPMDTTGVPVMLMAMCSDGSIIDIATVYSDINGHYEYLWTPPTEDTYKILASFIGSDAYWASSAETAVGVTAAHPSNGIEPEPTEPEPTGGITTEIAIIAAVAVVAVIAIVAYWVLRKRK